MSEQEYTGFSLEGSRLRAARIRVTGDRVEVVDLEFIDLEQAPDMSLFHASVKESSGPWEPGNPESSPGLARMGKARDISVEEDDLGGFDPGDLLDDVTEGPANDVERMANYLERAPGKKVRVGISLPVGSTLWHPGNPGETIGLQPKEIKQLAKEKIATVYHASDTAVQYAHKITAEDSLLVVSGEETSALLGLVVNAAGVTGRKVAIEGVLPEEAVATGLFRACHSPAPEEMTALVIVGSEVSRVLFLQDGILFSTLALIRYGHRHEELVEKVCSKILLELDQGNISHLDSIVFANYAVDEAEQDALAPHLREFNVRSLELNNDHIRIREGIHQPLTPYLTAIGMAREVAPGTSGVTTGLSLLPRRIRERQKPFKLEWHGAILLILIVLTPVLFTHVYQESRRQYDQMTRETVQTWQQVEQTKPIARKVWEIEASMASLNNQLMLLDSLSRNTLKWSTTLKILNDGAAQLGDLWITNVVTLGDRLVVEGYTRDQGRVPDLAGIFETAEIEKIIRAEKNAHEIHNFVMNVHDIIREPEMFNP